MTKLTHRLCVSSFLAMAVASGSAAFAQPPPASAATGTAQPQTAQPARAATTTEPTLIDNVVNDAMLSPHQQTAVARLKQDERAAREQFRRVEKTFNEAVANQLRSGKVDRSVLDSKIDAVADAAVKWHAAENAAFDRLHRILDQSQRALVARAVETTTAFHPMPPNDIGQLTQTYGLTAAQRREVTDVLRVSHAEHPAPAVPSGEQAKEIVLSFKSDDFKMENFRPALHARVAVDEREDMRVDMARKLLPILTPEQRERLADHVEQNGTP